MNALTTLVTALSVMFAVCLIALIFQIVYVLWRRRIFWRRLQGTGSSTGGGDVEFSGDSFYQPQSKELLYFFCWKNQTTRIEPDGAAAAAAAAAATAPSLPGPPEAAAATDDEVLKYLQGLYGQSRLLFTIKEEEKEEMEAENVLSPGEREVKKEKESVCSEEGLDLPVSTAVAVAFDETTPFSTPCASPPYYTPSPSPPRERSESYSSEYDNGVVWRVEGMQRP